MTKQELINKLLYDPSPMDTVVVDGYMACPMEGLLQYDPADNTLMIS